MTLKMKNEKDDLHNEETRVQSFVNQMLVSRMFIACFVGRFYVDKLNTYRYCSTSTIYCNSVLDNINKLS